MVQSGAHLVGEILPRSGGRTGSPSIVSWKATIYIKKGNTGWVPGPGLDLRCVIARVALSSLYLSILHPSFRLSLLHTILYCSSSSEPIIAVVVKVGNDGSIDVL